MPEVNSSSQHHDHTFGKDLQMPGERRTLIVVVVTATMMVIEIVTGILFGSMALLADGLHMASHAVALLIAYVAYIYVRRHARDRRFSFGTGKVNSLAGYTGAILLVVFAAGMAWESVDRFLHPVAIQFNHAIVIAVIGLIVNAMCAVILGHEHDGGTGAELASAGFHADAHGQGHDHHHDHGHAHRHHDAHGHDHNLRSAYLHVLADALTSLLAIGALLAGKYANAVWMDPLMGVVGAVLVARWSIGLTRATTRVLLDWQAPESMESAVRDALTNDGDAEVLDLHLWAIGPGRYAAAIALESSSPSPVSDYRRRLDALRIGLVHATIEIESTTSVDDAPTFAAAQKRS